MWLIGHGSHLNNDSPSEPLYIEYLKFINITCVQELANPHPKVIWDTKGEMFKKNVNEKIQK